MRRVPLHPIQPPLSTKHHPAVPLEDPRNVEAAGGQQSGLVLVLLSFALFQLPSFLLDPTLLPFLLRFFPPQLLSRLLPPSLSRRSFGCTAQPPALVEVVNLRRRHCQVAGSEVPGNQ